MTKDKEKGLKIGLTSRPQLKLSPPVSLLHPFLLATTGASPCELEEGSCNFHARPRPPLYYNRDNKEKRKDENDDDDDDDDVDDEG